MFMRSRRTSRVAVYISDTSETLVAYINRFPNSQPGLLHQPAGVPAHAHSLYKPTEEVGTLGVSGDSDLIA